MHLVANSCQVKYTEFLGFKKSCKIRYDYNSDIFLCKKACLDEDQSDVRKFIHECSIGLVICMNFNPSFSFSCKHKKLESKIICDFKCQYIR